MQVNLCRQTGKDARMTRRRENNTKSLLADFNLQSSEKQKLRFKSATHAVPPTFSGLSNQIAKEQWPHYERDGSCGRPLPEKQDRG